MLFLRHFAGCSALGRHFPLYKFVPVEANVLGIGRTHVNFSQQGDKIG